MCGQVLSVLCLQGENNSSGISPLCFPQNLFITLSSPPVSPTKCSLLGFAPKSRGWCWPLISTRFLSPLSQASEQPCVFGFALRYPNMGTQSGLILRMCSDFTKAVLWSVGKLKGCSKHFWKERADYWKTIVTPE